MVRADCPTLDSFFLLVPLFVVRTAQRSAGNEGALLCDPLGAPLDDPLPSPLPLNHEILSVCFVLSYAELRCLVTVLYFRPPCSATDELLACVAGVVAFGVRHKRTIYTHSALNA